MAGHVRFELTNASQGAAGLLAANVARKPTQATTLSPSGGLTILSNEIGQPEDCPTRTRENELREVPSTATRRTLSCACAVKGNAAAARYTYECRFLMWAALGVAPLLTAALGVAASITRALAA